MRTTLPFVLGLLLTVGGVHSQVARLSEHATGKVEIEAVPGDTLLIDLSTNLGRHSASGVTVFLQVPADGFRLLHAESTAGPFLPGDLFSEGVVVRNEEVEDGASYIADGHRLLEFSTLLGPAKGRGRGGSGSIACFRLVCEKPTAGTISIYHSPVHESRIVLADGRTEVPFYIAEPIEIDVDLDTSVMPSAWARIKAQR